MQYPTVFHLIAAVYHKTQVACVLIGGFAVNYYKVARQTADIDFLITEKDFYSILPLLKQEGYYEEYTEKVFSRLSTNNAVYLMDIDFLFVDKHTMDTILKESSTITIAEQSFRVPSLPHLIALKLHAITSNPAVRELRDFPDIIQLIKYNKLNVGDTAFKDLCMKYGTEDLYNRIVKNV